MRNVLIMIAMLAISGFIQAQEEKRDDTISYQFNASVAIKNMNLSEQTGILFETGYAMDVFCNGSVKLKGITLGANYGGHSTIGGTLYSLTDLTVSCSVFDNFSITCGYEFIHVQNVGESQNDISHAIFTVGCFERGKTTVRSILFYNVKQSFVYWINCLDFKVCDNVNFHSIVAYTTAEPYPVYGLVGVEILRGRGSVGINYSARKELSGFEVVAKCRLF